MSSIDSLSDGRHSPMPGNIITDGDGTPVSATPLKQNPNSIHTQVNLHHLIVDRPDNTAQAFIEPTFGMNEGNVSVSVSQSDNTVALVTWPKGNLTQCSKMMKSLTDGRLFEV